MKPDFELQQSGFASIGKSFRGSISDNAKRFRLVGGAYASMPKEQDGYFDINSARQLIGVLQALLDPNVREIILIGAVQVLKSVCGDIWVPFVIEHICRNMLILFETDPKALWFCDARLMETIKNHPIISQWIKQSDRHDNGKTELKLNGVKVTIGGMNDSNCSSLSWPYIWISEAYQHRSDGLLEKAIRRTEAFPNDCKIFIESRAGMAGEDLHSRAMRAHPVPLTWACPHCGGRQTWDFHQTRDDGSFAGMKFDDGYSIADRAATARWECLHCRKDIPDTKVMREQISLTYQQDYKVNGVSPKAVCFYLPREAANRNTFEKSVASYLAAKEAKESGLETKLQDWYMEERATFFEQRLTTPVVITQASGYDPLISIPDEDSRQMVIDVQQDLVVKDTPGSFWAEVFAADKRGNSFQLERGFYKSWSELDELQKRWKVSNQFVAIDGRKWTSEICKQVAARRVWMQAVLMGQKMMMPVCWTILLGDDARHFPWDEGNNRNYRVYSQPTKRFEYITNLEGKRECIPVNLIRWSNPSVKDQLYQLRIGGEGRPKFEALQHAQLSPEMQKKETGDFAYDKQMNSEVATEVRGKRMWVTVDKFGNKPNHYWDCANMRLTQLARRGLAGHSLTE